MRILYLASGRGEDYQCDVLFHGLRSLLGPNAVDGSRIASLYEQSETVKHAMYGRGYTVYGTLPEIDVDRRDILGKLRRRFYDVVIYGHIQRWALHLDDVQQLYPAHRIVYVDGEDSTAINWRLLGTGIYFKRELKYALPPYLQPIHFAVPSVKFISDQAFEEGLHKKVRVVAPCDPRDRSTYVFLTEEAYYQQYRESFFGITIRKAGWDCMRHHEIVSQGTAPLFIGLETCPAWTMHRLPRRELLAFRRLYEREPQMGTESALSTYRDLMRDVFSYYRRTFTTVALAEYVLGSIADAGTLDPGRRWPRALQARWLGERHIRTLASKLLTYAQHGR